MRDTNYYKSKIMHGGVATGNNFAWRAVTDSESSACTNYDTTTTSSFRVSGKGVNLGAYWKVYGYAA